MPFGKYRGRAVSELPEDYLEWLQENVDLRPPLAAAVAAALEAAEAAEMDARRYPVGIDAELVQRVYRRLAIKWHPDKGGNLEAMKAVNEFYDELRRGVG